MAITTYVSSGTGGTFYPGTVNYWDLGQTSAGQSMATSWAHSISANTANAMVISLNTTAQSSTVPTVSVSSSAGYLTAMQLGAVTFSDNSGNRGSGYTAATFTDKHFIYGLQIPIGVSVNSVYVSNATATASGYQFLCGNSVALNSVNPDPLKWNKILQTQNNSFVCNTEASAESYIVTAHFSPGWNWNSATPGTGGTKLVDNCTYLGGSNIQFGHVMLGFANTTANFVATAAVGYSSSSVGVIISPATASGFFAMF